MFEKRKMMGNRKGGLNRVVAAALSTLLVLAGTPLQVFAEGSDAIASEQSDAGVHDASSVSNLITGLPDVSSVSLDDVDAIHEAVKAYCNLASDEKALVLADLVAKLRTLVEGTRLNEAMIQLGCLHDPEEATLEDIATVDAARSAYDALAPQVKSQVPADLVDTLEKYEAKTKSLYDALTTLEQLRVDYKVAQQNPDLSDEVVLTEELVNVTYEEAREP